MTSAISATSAWLPSQAAAGAGAAGPVGSFAGPGSTASTGASDGTGAPANGSSSSSAGIGATSLGKDAFLKLLVAQLKYQDPSNPTDATQFLSQSAQFTLVEKFDSLAAATTNLVSAVQTQGAMSLVGRQISWSDVGGLTQSGVVTSVSVSGGQPTLKVGSTSVAMDTLTSVEAAPSATTA